LVGPGCNALVVRQRLVVASHQASGARPGASRPDFRPNELLPWPGGGLRHGV